MEKKELSDIGQTVLTWFFKLGNASQVTAKRVNPICILVSVNYVTLNRPTACLYSHTNLLSIKMLYYYDYLVLF